MDKDEALKLALEALQWHWGGEPLPTLELQAINAIKEALAQPEQEPVEHAVIAGALFDFMGWLTSRKERIVLSSADEASPAVNAIIDFAKMRGLSLNDAKVQDWNTTPPQRKPDQESDDLTIAYMSGFHDGKNKYAQQRKPLTDEQCINEMLNSGFERNSLGWSFTYGRLDFHLLKFARAIEAAHGIKGEA